MCGVVGAYSKNGVKINKFKELLKQARIRGLHACGIAYINNNKLVSKIITNSIDELELNNINTNYIIGHTRYSTSNLKFNQPIYDKNLAIVHNGVISQINPKEWKNIYKYNFTTENDSEILLRDIQNNKHPLNRKGSIASIVLAINKNIEFYFFRNETRPLYYSFDEDLYIASTKDILERSNIKNIIKTKSCIEYKLVNEKIQTNTIRKCEGDLQ